VGADEEEPCRLPLHGHGPLSAFQTGSPRRRSGGGRIDGGQKIRQQGIQQHLLPAVLYRSGQLFDIPRLAAVARTRRILLGFDCAHSIGAVPHRFDEWGVDWA
jgi:hypothetical protein